MTPKKQSIQLKTANGILLLLTTFLLSTIQVMAQGTEKYLSAKKSDPVKMGWMQGFPPPADKILKVADGSFFEFPALRYSVVHMREFLPSVRVGRGTKTPVPFKYALDSHIDGITFKPWNQDSTMTWEESLWKNYTDGIIILHKGKVVYERYFGALTGNDVHAVMSLTKSFTGTLASMLVAEGKLDETKLVSLYIPKLKNSGFGDATVRQVMDMTTGLKYSEEYSDPNADIWKYAAATNPLPKPKDYKGPDGFYEYLETIKKEGEHGEKFMYRTVNADALGWIIAKATNKSVNQLLTERIWSKLGMEQDAYYQVDGKGIAHAGGGFNAGLRDLARFGQTILNMGKWQGVQIIPKGAIRDIMKGGDTAKFAQSDHPNLKGWSYRDMWWITENKDGAFAARGVHGQTIYIDPAADMVIVRLASHPVASNAANDATSLPAYQAVADYLMKK